MLDEYWLAARFRGIDIAQLTAFEMAVASKLIEERFLYADGGGTLLPTTKTLRGLERRALDRLDEKEGSEG